MTKDGIFLEQLETGPGRSAISDNPRALLVMTISDDTLLVMTSSRPTRAGPLSVMTSDDTLSVMTSDDRLSVRTSPRPTRAGKKWHAISDDYL
jgi:hypothetical protein